MAAGPGGMAALPIRPLHEVEAQTFLPGQDPCFPGTREAGARLPYLIFNFFALSSAEKKPFRRSGRALVVTFSSL